jgi:hypothetical protein
MTNNELSVEECACELRIGNPTVSRVVGRLKAGCETGAREPGKGWQACWEASTVWLEGRPSERGLGWGRAWPAGIIEPVHSGWGGAG